MEPYPLRPLPAVVREEAAGRSILTEYATPRRHRYGLHLGLFLLTLASTVYTGGMLVGRVALYLEAGWTAYVLDGVLYAASFLLFLTAHEFGHYFAARRHGIDVSLPYFLPLGPLGFGTLGAVIRIREPIRRTRQLFDVGAAGPLAGVAVAFVLLAVAVATLPPPTYLLGVGGHEATVDFVLRTGAFPSPDVPPEAAMTVLQFTDTPLLALVRLAVPGLPSPSELMHYPVLLAAWLALFFTALNLLPVGQLDGGHVVYALFGPRVHAVVARVVTLALFVSGAVGFAHDVPSQVGPWGWAAYPVLGLVLFALFGRFFERDWRLALAATAALLLLAYGTNALLPGLAAGIGYWGWLIWVGLIVFMIRVDHPPVLVHEPLTPARRALGYLCLALFVLCFSIQPIVTGM